MTQGPFCTKCGERLDAEARVCPSCATPVGAAPDAAAVAPSGMGSGTPVPPEAKKWGWGAFLLNWIWGIGNRVWIAFLVFVPFVGWIMPFVLGAKGKEWAWQRKRWESVEHFERVQRLWAWWGLGIVVAFVVIYGVMLVFLVANTPSDVFVPVEGCTQVFQDGVLVSSPCP